MKYIKIIISFGISFLLLYFVATSVEWSKVQTEFSKADYYPFFTSTIAWILLFVLKAARWKYLLPPQEKSSLTLRTESLILGSLGTFILPLRAGEFIRPYFLSKTTKITFLTGFVSVFIERFFDLICVLALFGIVAPHLTTLPVWALAGVKALGILAVFIFIFMISASAFPNKLLEISKFFCEYFPNKVSRIILKLVNDIIEGATAIKSFQRFMIVVGYSIAIWIINVLIFYLFTPVVGIPSDIYLATTLTTLIALAVAAPSAPGFIGVYQAATLACFSLFNLPVEKAAAISILSHVHQYILYILGGVFVLFRHGISLKELVKGSK